ncbi:MAG: hypothetical protein RL477_43 [Pseudomonadota bacterium]|jgi:hypothetical protein
MSKSRTPKPPQNRNAPERGSPLDARRARQAEALRANLRRRKEAERLAQALEAERDPKPKG